MSLRLGLGNMSAVQEVLVLGLMLVSIFALFFSDLELAYKIGIAVLAFSLIFLASLATQLLKEEKKTSISKN
ncbi:hypothetical protein E2P61_00885 [Candidatus Bathyarchaeota archaeon]|nr:hypothetical protein E2P61_00885 [Candidatus Bathyarchaeota archaeon]